MAAALVRVMHSGPNDGTIGLLPVAKSPIDQNHLLIADFNRQFSAYVSSLAKAVCLGNLLKRKNLVDDRAELAGLDQGT
jgi:hypothetical protein